jgi:hypothetical protein
MKLKSLFGSYGSFRYSTWFCTIAVQIVKSSVYPSAGALATASHAMIEPAPGRFSTTNGCPSCCAR